MKNWAGNVTYAAARLHQPTSVEQLCDIVAGAPQIRAVGTRHSFNRIADTEGDLVSVAELPRRTDVSAGGGQVVVSAGLRYGDVATVLDAAGFALANLPSLPHISVAGAVATGTHGSGDANRALASSVAAVELVTADGSLITLRRGQPDFPGAVVALGALGVVVSLTLEIVPTFAMRQYVYDDLPVTALLDNLDAVLASAYSVSAFTNWRAPVRFQVWLKQLASAPPAPPTWLGARLADGPRHPISGMPAEHCTQQFGVTGPWHLRLPHFRLEFTPSTGEELQTEFFVPRTHGVAAIAALADIADQVAPVLQIAEVRSVAADDQWLSPAYGRDNLALHFTWLPDGDAVAPVVALVERALEPFAPRPHWAKVASVPPATVIERYEHADAFASLMRRHDPAGKFANAYVRALFPPGSRERA
ncbi:MAG TPA: FAD-binding protein [Micromonosporaceae bacterium]